MFKGFYNLTSGMLSQGRRLDVVSHNMTNISTAGYKADTYKDSTFQDVIISRLGNKDKIHSDPIGEESYILAPHEIFTDYTQGAPEETGLPLDFCIQGEGFFCVSREGGETGYTRAGSFCLNDEGYLCLAGQGMVLDDNMQTIQLPTDKIYADQFGNLYTETNRNYLATLGVYQFPDNNALERNDRGLFMGDGAQPSEDFRIRQGYIERSNVDMTEVMVAMMTSERALQSAAEILKMYDQVITKANTELGRL
ncbi:MAG: flagellar hook-basal body protein [Oscillospiraceae bacterium]|nr:flagellar hook-basal body protein [Oscillospiraceae bacterium]